MPPEPAVEDSLEPPDSDAPLGTSADQTTGGPSHRPGGDTGTNDPETPREVVTPPVVADVTTRGTYRETLGTVRSLRLSDSEKILLVALYSTDVAPDLGALLDLTDQALEATLQSLHAKELIRAPVAETALTGKGQLAVSDRLDSVNH